jgi:hypothetical protein
MRASWIGRRKQDEKKNQRVGEREREQRRERDVGGEGEADKKSTCGLGGWDGGEI